MKPAITQKTPAVTTAAKTTNKTTVSQSNRAITATKTTAAKNTAKKPVITKSAVPVIKWLKEVQDHDYAAANSYLSLIYSPNKVEKMVTKLQKAKITHFMAKDIFRASRLSLLGVSNSHVIADHAKVKAGIAISPLLLVRQTKTGTVVIADGYHRLCAAYQFNEDISIPCKII